MPHIDTIILDITKTMLGSFLGAGLAFFSNYVFRQSQKEEEQVAAGNVAMAMLAEMTIAFLVYKRGVIDSRNKTRGVTADLPDWGQLLPIVYEFDESLEVNIQSLAFLFKNQNTSAMGRVFGAQSNYKSLVYFQKEHYEVMTEIQAKLSLLTYDPNAQTDLDYSTREIPKYLLGRIEAINALILRALKEDEPHYINAIASLRADLSSHLGSNRIIEISIPDEWKDLKI
ncbi:hypothetical protein [Undibacterium sp. TC9W]|uniref:hypothetical protein n=1 Tax=Undibacterium sp. TC9W TaxID=3413053 RepID=UPI003BEFF6F2